MCVNLVVAYAFLLLLVVVTAFNTARRRQLRNVPPCGPKSTHSSSPEYNNSLVACVKYVMVGLFGCAAKLHPSEGSHEAFILATIARDTRVIYISLGACSSAARQLCKL